MIFQLFWVFARIGALTFGGGYAMVSLIERELCSRGWIGPAEFADIVAVSQMTPGPLALNVATYVGRQTAGIPGALSASLGLTLPAVLITGIALWAISKSRSHWSMKAAVRGIRAAVLGLIASAVLFFTESSIINITPGDEPLKEKLTFSPAAAGIFLIVIFLVKRFKLKPIQIILISALLGCTAYIPGWL